MKDLQTLGRAPRAPRSLSPNIYLTNSQNSTPRLGGNQASRRDSVSICEINACVAKDVPVWRRVYRPAEFRRRPAGIRLVVAEFRPRSAVFRHPAAESRRSLADLR